MVTVFANDVESLNEDATCEVITTIAYSLFSFSFIHLFTTSNDPRKQAFGSKNKKNQMKMKQASLAI